jgi:hypothetical protein
MPNIVYSYKPPCGGSAQTQGSTRVRKSKGEDIDEKKKSQAVALAGERNIDFVLQVADRISQHSNIRGTLLRFVKGAWLTGTGQNEDEIDEGTAMTVNLDSTLMGWQMWEDEKPTDSDLGLVVDGFQPKARSELSLPPDRDGVNEAWPTDDKGNPVDPWQSTMLVLMHDADGELFTYVASSKGGKSALGALLKQWGQRVKEGEDSSYPIVELGSDSYKHRKYSRVEIPTLEITGWEAIEDYDWAAKAAGAQVDDQPDDKAPVATRKKAAPTEQAKPAAKPTAKSATQKGPAVKPHASGNSRSQRQMTYD